ncbi:MAG: hypothetical protein U9R36_06265, partial [Elusimicrobiota bacterium]|nr:hypothetical protein [Elusimicrobiota bacterium]
DLGTAMRLTLLSNHDKGTFWAYYWAVDYNYFDMLGEGYDATYNGRNENRYSVGTRVEPKKNMYTQAEFIFQELRKPVNETVSVYEGGGITNTRTYYKDDNLLKLKVRQSWDITEKFLLRYTATLRNNDEWRTKEIRFSPMYSASHRLELTHRASDKIKLKAVFKKSKEQFDELDYLRKYNTDDGNYAELRYRPTGPLVIKARAFVHESGYGVGWSLKPTLSLSKKAKLKLEYEQEPKADGGFGSTFLAQYDMAW